MTASNSLDLSPADLHASIAAREADGRIFGGGIDFAKWFTEEHVSYRDPKTGRNILHALALGGESRSLNWILELIEDHGAEAIFKLVDPNAVDCNGYTPLTLAILMNSIADPKVAGTPSVHLFHLFDLLCKHSTDLDAPMPNGLSPIGALTRDFPRNYSYAPWRFLAILVAHGARMGHRNHRTCASAALVTHNEPALDLVISALEKRGRTLAECLSERGLFETLVILADFQDRWCYRDNSSVFGLVERRVHLTGVDKTMRSITMIATELGLSPRAMAALQGSLFRQTCAEVLP